MMVSRRRKALCSALVLALLGIFSIGILFHTHLSTHSNVNHSSTRIDDSDFVGDEVRVEDCEDTCATYLSRLDHYCQRSMLNGGQLVAQEGTLTEQNDKFHLKYIHIVVRHGDRTPVESYRIGSNMLYQCGLVRDDVIWDGLRDFPPPMPLPLTARVNNAHLKLHPGTQSKRCGVGKLTQSGFKQHRNLGSLLQTKYSSFLKALYQPWQSMFVQSSDISRTVRSGAAFLLGFLPDSSKVRKSAQIHVSRGTVHSEPPPGIEKAYPACRGLYDFHEEELVRSGYLNTEKKLYKPFFEQLSNMFHIPISSRPSRVFDHFMTRGCHAPTLPLPCNEKGCVDFDFALRMSTFNDWIWSNKYPLNSSTLTVLPFLRHSVLEPMELAVSGEKGEAENHYNLMLTFSHDDTLTMVLNTLGVHVEKWMPYASRVVFELWQEEGNEYYVRVLFNGAVITHGMFPWQLYENEEDNAYSELLPLEYWSEFLTTGPYREIKSYNTACKNHYM